MKKKRLLAKILSACSLVFALCACTTLDYVDTDFETVKSSNIQTNEMFSLRAIEKSSGERTVSAGISQTQLDGALVLYLNIKNNSNEVFKFDVKDVLVTSPIGEVSFLSPVAYIEAYQNFEAQNYASMSNASTMIGSFASIQNQQYRQNSINNSTALENRSQSGELLQLEKTIQGIQSHSITSYKFLDPKSEEYFYIFLKKPDEYPIVVNYLGLSYKFGGKKNAGE